ncbi:MAG TPA: MEMO1 family protein [Methanomicrobia archaeon]|nr:MEMO1 family protein [Methanomicrobia archaeon]
MRKSVVAGSWYEGDADRLNRQLQGFFADLPRALHDQVLGAVVPHAGYLYSGRVAASVYARLPPADTYVLLGTNHQAIGSLIAVSAEPWETPLGVVAPDAAFIEALPRRLIAVDETAHRYEHSIELQLPFLQFCFGRSFRIVPISIGLGDEETVREIGDDLASTIAAYDKRVMIIASSDFTHYEPEKIARDKDGYVIEAITELDVPKFFKRVYERNVTACGIAPIGAMLQAVRRLGATSGIVTAYMTSGDITGERSSVVGYGGIILV